MKFSLANKALLAGVLETPLVMMWFVSKTGNFLSPAWYYVFGAIIGLASLAVCEHGRRKATTLQSALVY